MAIEHQGPGSLWTDKAEAYQASMEALATPSFKRQVAKICGRTGWSDTLVNFNLMDGTIRVGFATDMMQRIEEVTIARWNYDDLRDLKGLLKRVEGPYSPYGGPDGFARLVLDERPDLILSRPGNPHKDRVHPMDRSLETLYMQSLNAIGRAGLIDRLEWFPPILDVIKAKGGDLATLLKRASNVNDYVAAKLATAHCDESNVVDFLESCAYYTVPKEITELVEACVDKVGLERVLELARENNGFLNRVETPGQAGLVLKFFNATPLSEVVAHTYASAGAIQIAQLLKRLHVRGLTTVSDVLEFEGELLITKQWYHSWTRTRTRQQIDQRIVEGTARLDVDRSNTAGLLVYAPPA